MTDRYENIRRALEMGPTPGPWRPSYDKGSTRDIFTEHGNLPVCMVRGVTYVGQEQYLANGHFIAACDPDTLRALLEERDVLRDEVERLRARVAELERDLDARRAELLEARHIVGEAWFAGDETLAEGIARKCRMFEGDAEHWRKAAEARALRVEDGDHVLHRFAAIAAAKNDGRSAITLTVWSDGTVDAEQYATLDGELDEWGTLYQERRASWGSRPIGEIDALVDDLESGDWYTVEHRAPQDFWREIAVLRDEVERYRFDIEMACENTPWPGCECPGCGTARERAEAALKGGSDG